MLLYVLLSIGHLLVFKLAKKIMELVNRHTLYMWWQGQSVCLVLYVNPLSPSLYMQLTPSLSLENVTDQKLTDD